MSRAAALARRPIGPFLWRVAYPGRNGVEVIIERLTVGRGQLFQRSNRDDARLLDAPQLPLRDARDLSLLDPLFFSQCGARGAIFTTVSAPQTLRFAPRRRVDNAPDRIEVQVDIL